jgi:hypothetical protein
MRAQNAYALSLAGLLAWMGQSGCASTGGEKTSSNPSAQQVQTPQQQSEQALKEASDAQKKASEQAQKAAQAQQEVQQKQQELAQAQQTARTEQTKAQQLQREANQATQRSMQTAQQSQQQASQALSQSSQDLKQGQQRVSGLVQQAGARQLVVQPMGGGEAMTMRVTPDTNVIIDGQRRSASQLKQGQQAIVAYRVSGTQPTALSVQVSTGHPTSQSDEGTGSQSDQSGAGSQDSQQSGTGSQNSQSP